MGPSLLKGNFFQLHLDVAMMADFVDEDGDTKDKAYSTSNRETNLVIKTEIRTRRLIGNDASKLHHLRHVTSPTSTFSETLIFVSESFEVVRIIIFEMARYCTIKVMRPGLGSGLSHCTHVGSYGSYQHEYRESITENIVRQRRSLSNNTNKSYK